MSGAVEEAFQKLATAQITRAEFDQLRQKAG
jgi:hypothetical protein